MTNAVGPKAYQLEEGNGMHNKRIAPLVILLILAAVLGGAFVAHDLLAKRYAPTEPLDADQAQGANAASGDIILLADHDATVYTDLGEPLKLSTIADGKPLVINFWATWCPYCVDELPDFQDIVEEYGDRVNFAFVDVADGQRERAEDAQAWLVDNGFDDLPDYYDTSLEASTTFGVFSYPTTVVVSADGEILTISAGRIDPILMRGSLEQLV